MPIQNNFPSMGFDLLPNIRRANIYWECLAVIQNLRRENHFEWAFMNGPKSVENIYPALLLLSVTYDGWPLPFRSKRLESGQHNDISHTAAVDCCYPRQVFCSL